MKILGIYNGHTASASLMIDGQVVGCVSEERFTGIKNQTGYPEQSIKYLLESNHLKSPELDYIVFPLLYSAPVHASKQTKELDYGINVMNIAYKPLNMLRKSLGFLSYYLHFLIPLRVFAYDFLAKTVGLYASEKEKEMVAQKLQIESTKLKSYEHHMSHAASAYYASPYNTEKTLVLTMDGEGDTICASVNVFDGEKYERLSETTRNNSFGLLYMYLTGYLGMKMTEHEYKVMGLAPYAKEQHAEKLYQKVKDVIVLDPKDKLKFKAKFHMDQAMHYFETEMKGYRFDNIAAAFQKLLEVRVTEWVEEAVRISGIKTICLAGGVFMNVKLNQKILALDCVEKIFIMPSCGDESSIIGASYLCSLENSGTKTFEPIGPVYWGPSYTNDDVKTFIKDNNVEAKYKVEYFSDIEKEIAKRLSENKVVGRMRGRMEFGARALGNRSILANPSDPDVVMIINELMKDRDFWMPFAPSMLKERENDYIINPKHADARYMILAFDSTDLARKEMKAALHPYDFTCRPQMIEESLNSRYHYLIKQFEELTGIGGVLNTSFNLHGFPIVLGPKDAFYAFEHSGLSHLALENYMISKE